MRRRICIRIRDKADSKIRIDTKAFAYAILMLPFFELGALQYAVGAKAHYLWGVAAFVVFALLNVVCVGKACFGRFHLCFLGYGAVILLTACWNGSISLGMAYSFAVIWVLLQGLHNQPELMLRAMVFLFMAVIAINLAAMPFFEEQVYINASTLAQGRFSGIIGGRNVFAPTLLPMGCCILYYFSREENKEGARWGWMFLALAFLSVILAKSMEGEVVLRSATGMVMAALCFFAALFVRKHNLWAGLCLWAIAVAHVALTGFHGQIMNSAIMVKLCELLHRGNDLTQRTYIWDSALERISHALLLGNGRGNALVVDIRGWSCRYGETHNMFLDILYNGGIAALAFYVCAILCAVKVGRKREFAERVLLAGFLCFLLIGLTESVNDKIMVWILLGLLNESKAADRRARPAGR